MRTKAYRRAIGVLAVAVTASLAWAHAGDGESVFITPRLIGIKQFAGSGSTGAVTIQNVGNAAFTGRIIGNCGSAPAMRIAMGSGDPFTVNAMTSLPVLVECPPTLPVGMHRCTFDVQSSSNASIGTFDAFCSTFSNEVLTAAPLPVTFSNQTVGVQSAVHQLFITNPTGTTVDPMQLQVDNPNFLVGSPCQNSLGCDAGQLIAGSSAPVEVMCKPLVQGTHTGKLFLTSTTGIALPPVALTCATGSGSGSGGPILTITPPNVNLPPIDVDNASSNVTVELGNGGGSGNLAISSITLVDAAIPGAANDWSFTLDGQCTTQMCTLAPSQKLNVRLTFDPSNFNSRPATLIVNYSDPMGSKQASVSLEGSGLGATAQLIGTPTIEFGVVPLNTPGMQRTFKMQNLGNQNTMVQLAAVPKDPFIFGMDALLLPGETTITVGCLSATEIDATSTISITGPAVAGTLTVPMHCDVRNTQLTTNPTSIPLDEVRIGTTASPISVTIDRVGSGSPLGLTSATLGSANPNLTLGGLSGLSTPATVSLMVSPTTEGSLANSIVVTPAVGQSVPVPITGSVVTASLVADEVMTLGTFCVKQPVSSTAVNLTSTGTATIRVNDVGLELGDDSPFDLAKSSPTTYPTSLAPNGGKATVIVTPKRSDAPDDEVSDMLVWSTDAGEKRSKLTTRFVADGGAVAPEQLDFGDVAIHLVNDDAQGVTLQNCSTDPLQLIEPVVPAPFELTGEFPLLLEPAAKATFSILFLPTDTGPVAKDLTIESMSGDMFTVTLRGNGVTGDGSGSGGDDDGTLDETSFYACGCRSNGNPSSVLVIALAMLLVLRRRVSR